MLKLVHGIELQCLLLLVCREECLVLAFVVVARAVVERPRSSWAPFLTGGLVSRIFATADVSVERQGEGGKYIGI